MYHNRIDKIRTEIAAHFNPETLIEECEEVSFSPDKKYFFKASFYELRKSSHHHSVVKIELFEMNSKRKLFEFIRNDDTTFHSWLIANNRHYLFLSEDIEGKSIFDFYNNTFLSYSYEEDRFIWAEYYFSPDNTKMAIIGCYWACPYEVRVYDISAPMAMPYKELFNSIDFVEKIEWIDNETLKLTDNKEEFCIINIS